MNDAVPRHPKVWLKIWLIVLAIRAVNVEAQGPSALRMVQTIPLPNVEGRIDHMAVDVKGQRLFIAALGNNSIEVLDLRGGKHLKSITGFSEPQGVGFIPEFDKIFIANGEGGVCDVLSGSSFERINRVKFSDDADNIRYDAATRRVYIGYGSGGIGIMDAATGDRLGDIKLDGHPESFQLEKSGPRMFVNVPTARNIVVVDRDKRATITSWPTAGATANFPMAIDETHHRLFVGFRRPAKLIVFDTQSGKITANLTSLGDVDDLFYDSARRRIYVSGGEGFLSTFQQNTSDHYEPVAKTPTAPGARTSLFAPELNRLYVAVPRRGAQKAEVRVYEAEP